MKWKDSDDRNEVIPDDGEPYYEDGNYMPFEDQVVKKKSPLSGISLRYLFWGVAIGIVILLVLLLAGSLINGPVDRARVDALEQRITQLEQKLAKVDDVDEKVSRIWEQARSFETFKTRFDRSEASMSLRMDHLAMSLDALQKKTNETHDALDKLEKAAAVKRTVPALTAKKKGKTVKTHTVAVGETLYRISQLYHLTVEELRSMNNLPKGAVIHVGQVLVVKAPGK
jgi:LysM repeat protein